MGRTTYSHKSLYQKAESQKKQEKSWQVAVTCGVKNREFPFYAWLLQSGPVMSDSLINFKQFYNKINSLLEM